MDGETILFVGAHYEVKNGSEITKYYMAGSTRIAMRKYQIPQPMTVEYMLSDHLGSTSLTADADGNKVLEIRYKAWGEVRATWTSSPSTTPAYKMPLYQYTGQAAYLDDPLTSGVTEGFGLMFYNARWYDPYITHFVQADTITPGGVQGLDRYAYNFNNPTKYTDPSGHFPFGPLNNVITLVLNMVTQAQEKTAVDEVSKNSSTSVDVLVKMFSSNKLAGNTPQARLETVLAGTNSGPGGQQFRGNYSDTGFSPQFQDGQDQVGHFLTAVGIGYRSDDDDFGISMMVGHELFPDFGKFTIPHQIVLGMLNRLYRKQS